MPSQTPLGRGASYRILSIHLPESTEMQAYHEHRTIGLIRRDPGGYSCTNDYATPLAAAAQGGE